MVWFNVKLNPFCLFRWKFYYASQNLLSFSILDLSSWVRILLFINGKILKKFINCSRDCCSNLWIESHNSTWIQLALCNTRLCPLVVLCNTRLCPLAGHSLSSGIFSQKELPCSVQSIYKVYLKKDTLHEALLKTINHRKIS